MEHNIRFATKIFNGRVLQDTGFQKMFKKFSIKLSGMSRNGSQYEAYCLLIAKWYYPDAARWRETTAIIGFFLLLLLFWFLFFVCFYFFAFLCCLFVCFCLRIKRLQPDHTQTSISAKNLIRYSNIFSTLQFSTRRHSSIQGTRNNPRYATISLKNGRSDEKRLAETTSACTH